MMTDNEREELLLKAKPILFNTEMVNAILDGRKTVTRRIVKDASDIQGLQPYIVPIYKEPQGLIAPNGKVHHFKSPYQVGDILYVRETFANLTCSDGTYKYVYKSTDEYPFGEKYIVKFKWHPSIHMPKEAARIFLRVTNVRVERLQDITPEQIDAEGCKEYAYNAKTGELLPSKPTWFKIKWGSTIKKSDIDKYGWAANPWVWVIEFERIDLR